MSGYKHLYIEYHRIDQSSFHEKVRFYEKNINQLQHLAFDEWLEIKSDYLFSLFEIGKYQRFLAQVDGLIEVVIMENITEINGHKIFEQLLFTKAACLYNEKQYDDATHVAGELVKINPDHYYIQKLYRQCLRHRGLAWYEINKGIAVVFLLSGISVVFAELLIVDPFYEKYSTHVMYFRNFLFSGSLLLVIFNEFKIRSICHKLTSIYRKKYASKEKPEKKS